MSIVCVSGGFDPCHIGHIRYIQDAYKYGEVVVILNSDAWLLRKKGYIFMPFDERKEMLMALRWVKDVVAVDDEDGTVCRALAQIKPDFFAKGGDRGPDNTPEQETCGHLGIDILWSVGGDDKVQASSRLIDKAVEEKLANAGIF